MNRAIAFDTIRAAAARRLGGERELTKLLVSPEPPGSLAMVGDDRYLSVMSRRIFRAGLKHSMVDARWPAFEEAFAGFDVEQVADMDDAAVRQLLKDDRLIRHAKKLFAVRDNAVAMRALAAEQGGFGSWLAQWPEDDIVGLWRDLQRRFSQMGGQSGPAFLRMAGKDTFLLTDWVGAALKHWGVYAEPIRSRRAQDDIQAIFNAWHDVSDLPLCQMSQILALSVD